MSSIMCLMLTVRDILLHTEPPLESISAGPPGIGAFYFQIYISEHLQNSVAYTCLMMPFTFHSPAPLP